MKVPFYLAPMAELSHRALRELIEGFGGCDCYFTEMISAAALLAGGPFEKWYIDTAPNPEKCVFQLVGSDIDTLANAAAFLDKIDCGGIDINMGCSAPLIRKTGAGAAWMASIDRAGDLISRIRPQVKRRLSVKLRTGFKDDFDYLARFCRRLEQEGVDLITLHPRLVTEKFKRLAKWEYVAALKKELKIPVAGNGDISDAAGLLRRADGSCDAVMAGRAAVKQPWIFAQAKEENYLEEINPETFTNNNQARAACASKKLLGEPVSEPLSGSLQRRTPKIVFPLRTLEDIGLQFLDLLAKHQPLEFHASRAKRFFSYFCQNLKWGTNLFNQINREDTLLGIKKVWSGYFKENEE